MSADEDPPRLVEGNLAELLQRARRDGPSDAERAALDASLRAALPTPSRAPSPWRVWTAGVIGAAAIAAWIGAGAPRPSTPTPRPEPATSLAPRPPASERSDASGPAAHPTALPAPRPHTPAPPPVARVDDDDEPAPPRCAPARHVAAVEDARRALRARDPAAALSIAVRDRERCPGGALREERERIAVEALATLGRRAETLRSLAAFERAYPTSLHRRALRALVDAPAPAALPSTP